MPTNIYVFKYIFYQLVYKSISLNENYIILLKTIEIIEVVLNFHLKANTTDTS